MAVEASRSIPFLPKLLLSHGKFSNGNVPPGAEDASPADQSCNGSPRSEHANNESPGDAKRKAIFKRSSDDANGGLARSISDIPSSPSTAVTTITSTNTYHSSIPHIQTIQFTFPNESDDLAGADNSSVPAPPSQTGSVATSINGYVPSSGPPSTHSSFRAPKRDRSEHKESMSEREYHKAKQQEHKASRRRHFTDPVDFDGILKLIGGCGRWQLWVYFLISLQQIPHAMFNLAIIFMMISPQHWCYEAAFDRGLHKEFNWTDDQVKQIRLVLILVSLLFFEIFYLYFSVFH